MRFVGIIQARTGSSRLPNKIFKPICGKLALLHQIERLRDSKMLSELVIATTENPADDAVVDFAKTNRLRVFRGSENDVLSRFYFCAESLGLREGIVRLTSDCPLIDPEIVDQTISQFESLWPNVDYVANTLERTFPRGLDCEVFHYNGLKRCHQETKDPAWREHVTPLFYRPDSPVKFRTSNYKGTPDLSAYRLTLDTPEDLQLISGVFEDLYPQNPKFRLGDIVKLLKSRPDLLELNRLIQQKEVK